MMKKFLTIALVALAIAGGIFAALKPGQPKAEQPPSVALAAPAHPDDGVVTYFTTDVRCVSCREIEALTRKAVESAFAGPMADGTLVFEVVNTDRPENTHFIEDYKLVSKTVIVSERHGEKETDWKNLQDVWLKLKDPEDFTQYVVEGVKSALPVKQ